MKAALEVRSLSFSYGPALSAPKGNGAVLSGLSLSLETGAMTAVLGPNGSGKTTLLRLISGVLKPADGQVCYNGTSLEAWGRREVAYQMAVVPQEFHMPFAFHVREVVALGRTPYYHGLGGESKEDRRAIVEAMEMTASAGLASRPFNELSGGERRRVLIAMALAQQPRLLLLDEPTAHLDISHQTEIMALLSRLNAETGMTILAAMHDLNLAALYFPRLVLLHQGRLLADGSPSEVLTQENIARAYDAKVLVQTHPSLSTPQIVLLPDRGDDPGPS